MLAAEKEQSFAALSVCLDLSPSHGGAYRAVVDLARAVASPILSFQDGTGRLPCEELPLPLCCVDMKTASPWRRFARLSSRQTLVATAAAQSPALVFCHSLFRSHNDWVRRFCLQQGVPYIAIPHGSLDPWVFQNKRLRKACWMSAFGRPYCREAQLMLFATESEKRKAEQTLGFVPPAAVIPWPVNALTALPTHQEQTAARQRLGLPLDRRMLLFFGRYHSMKRPLETVRAFLDTNLPDAMLVMAGFDGDVTAEQLRRLNWPKQDRLHVLGPLLGESRTDLFIAADAFISWSYRENFCYSAAESLGFGRAVILSPGNDLCGELRGEKCGWFPVDDSLESLSQSLRAFAALPRDQLAAMGEAGRLAAQKQFSQTSFHAKLREIMSTIHETKPTKPRSRSTC